MVEGSEPSDYEKAIQPNTKIIYIETPSNPLLSILDVEKIAQIAKVRVELF